MARPPETPAQTPDPPLAKTKKPTPKKNRETHANKQQLDETGPQRASRTPPRDHFDERS
jgi:hypothetical protein